MGTKTQELINTLEELVSILKKDNSEHWVKWFNNSLKTLRSSDYSGIDHILGAYGGMGSFSDLIIGQSYKNNVFEWKPNAQENNNKLDELRAKIYDLADYIKRNHEIEN